MAQAEARQRVEMIKWLREATRVREERILEPRLGIFGWEVHLIEEVERRED